MEMILLLAVLLLVGVWLWLDANRLQRHVSIAEKLMANGCTEEDAMEKSGCNYWDTPLYRRLLKSYPSVPNRKNMNTDITSEIDMFDALAAKVRAGQPIHVTTPTNDPLLRLHMSTVARLRAETGMPVHVV